MMTIMTLRGLEEAAHSCHLVALGGAAGATLSVRRLLPLLSQVRAIISDFAVFITILTMVFVDYALGIPSPKLQVPSKFKVSTRGLFYFYGGFFGTGNLSMC